MSAIRHFVRRVVRAPAQLAEKWLSQELARCLRANDDEATETALRQNIAELARECRILWAMKLSACVFVAVTVLGIHDSALFTPGSRVQLPIVGVAVTATSFFVVAPLVLLALLAYMQLYIGHLHHLLRRLVLLPRQHALDPDLLYPWFGALAGPGGGARATWRIAWALLSWWSVPGTIAICCVRIFPIPGDMYGWLFGIGLVPTHLLEIALMGAWLLVASWAWARRAIDRKVVSASRLGDPFPDSRKRSFVVLDNGILIMPFLALAAIHPGYQQLCEKAAQRYSHLPICSVDLSYIRLEETNSKTVAGRPIVANRAYLLGANLQHADLRTAEFHGAWLSYADFAQADMTGASFVPWVPPWLAEEEDTLREMLDMKLAGDFTPDEPIGAASMLGEHNREKSETKWRAFYRDGWQALWPKKNYVRRVAMMQSARLAGARATDAHFDDVYARDLDARRLNADGAFFDRATIIESNLTSASLQSTSFRAAIADRAYLNGARLAGSDWLGSCAPQAMFSSAQLQGARLRAVHFEGAFFDDANLDGADLRDAHFEGAFFRRTSLRAVDFRDAHVQGAMFTEVDFSGADLRGWQTGVLDATEVSKTWPSPFTAMSSFRAGKPTEFDKETASDAVCEAVESGIGPRSVDSDDACYQVRAEVLNRIARTQSTFADEWFRSRPMWLRWFTGADDTKGQAVPASGPPRTSAMPR